MARRRNRRSKSHLLKLPKSVLAQVHEMLTAVGEERKTYQEIADWVNAQGYRTSKSAVDRYAKFFYALEKVRFVGEQARTIIEAAGEDPLKIEEATSKLGAVVMMEVFQEAMRPEGDIDVKHIGRLLGDFARLQKSSVDREKFKADFVEKAKKIMADAEKKSPEASKEELLEFIKDRVYGLK